jgi:single-strand DNA-binding protein
MSDQITVKGNIGADPVVRYVGQGGNQQAVANFNIANTPRKQNAVTKEWEDQPTTWWTIECWGALAENVVASLRKGNAVIVQGTVKTDEYTKDNEKRTKTKITADVVGVNLRTQTVNSVARSNPSINRGGGSGNGGGGYSSAPAAASYGSDDETPF